MELNDILLLLEKFETSDLSSLKVRLKGDEFEAARNEGTEYLQPKPSLQSKADEPVKFMPAKKRKEETVTEENEAEPEMENWTEVSSPIVGTFYNRPSEKEESFVKLGQKVKKGDVLCILEAMKIMNEIKSPHDGTIKRILLDLQRRVLQRSLSGVSGHAWSAHRGSSGADRRIRHPDSGGKQGQDTVFRWTEQCEVQKTGRAWRYIKTGSDHRQTEKFLW